MGLFGCRRGSETFPCDNVMNMMPRLADEIFAFGADDSDERIKFFLAVRTVIQMGGDVRQDGMNVCPGDCLLGKALELPVGHAAVTAAFVMFAQTVYEFFETILGHVLLHSTSLART